MMQDKETAMSKIKGYFEEYVSINGISQYFLHCPSNDGEVMLIIHGGPGQSEAAFAYYAEPNPPVYTAVYYDQRGTGKTLRKNPTNGNDVTFQALLEDLAETVQYLKHKYQKDKIIIQGHSWGSVLGLSYAYQHPEDVLYYIGAAQVVDYLKGERITLEKLRRLSADNPHDSQTLEALESQLTFAQDFLASANTLMKFKRKYGLGINIKRIAHIAMKSPVFGFADMLAMIRAQKLTGQLQSFLGSFSAEEMISFEIPVYFIHGDNDGQIPASQVKEYVGHITAPDKGFYLVADAGHVSVADNLKGILSAMSDIQSRFDRYCTKKSQ